MTKYAAFLRGVNVGGVNLKMAEVAAALTDAGFTEVRTVLASGNVVLESSAGVAAVRRKAEAALRERFGYDAWVLAYDIGTVREVVDAYPFERDADGYQSYVTFVADKAVLDELAALGQEAGPDERISRGDGVVYWQVPKGGTWTAPSARRWARRATSRRPRRATCARSTRCCAERYYRMGCAPTLFDAER